jgi:hypothetical protein
MKKQTQEGDRARPGLDRPGHQLAHSSDSPTRRALGRKTAAAKAAQQDSPLQDARSTGSGRRWTGSTTTGLSRLPFDRTGIPSACRHPWRIPRTRRRWPPSPAKSRAPKAPAIACQSPPPESGETLLKHAIDATHIRRRRDHERHDAAQRERRAPQGGRGLHGNEVKARLVLIRIKRLTTSFRDAFPRRPGSGTAEMRVRLKLGKGVDRPGRDRSTLTLPLLQGGAAW